MIENAGRRGYRIIDVNSPTAIYNYTPSPRYARSILSPSGTYVGRRYSIEYFLSPIELLNLWSHAAEP